jgi:Primase X
MNTEEGLDFILTHFVDDAESSSIWPRTISTKTTEGRQVLVYNKEEALARFKQANYLDCRINAYPGYVEFKGINRQPPTFIFIDIDRYNFKTERTFNIAIDYTCKKIKEMLGGNANPTIIWSGKGIHFYQPVKLVHDKASTLEEIDVFSEFLDPTSAKKDLSTRFMRFAEEFFTGKKHDPAHRPSVRSCLVRVPHSLNSKCIELETGRHIEDPEVKLIQRWDGHRPAINYILRDFRRWLINNKIKERLELQSIQRDLYRLKHKRGNGNYNNYNHSNVTSVYYNRLEKLLLTPISDHRKFVCYWLLSRYLINIRHLNYEQAYATMKNWLCKCDEVERLFPSARVFDALVKNDIRDAQKSGKVPIGDEKLKEMNEEVYKMLLSI